MKPNSYGSIALSLFFSVISIGYSATITRPIPTGVSSLAVPYLIGSNTVAELMPTVPEGTQLYKIARTPSTARWTVNQFQSGAWQRPSETLLPGEGAYIRNPGAPFNVTFSGTTPPPPLSGSALRWRQPDRPALPAATQLQSQRRRCNLGLGVERQLRHWGVL